MLVYRFRHGFDFRISWLTVISYLDIAVICEHKDDLKMAEAAATKAVEVKKGCQGEDFPNFGRYTEVLERIKVKMSLQETEDRV